MSARGDLASVGAAAKSALERLHGAVVAQDRALAASAAYLTGKAEASGNIALVAELGRDIAFATAVSLAIVIAAPVVAGGATAVAGSAGLSSSAGSALAGSSVALTSTALGAGMEATGRGGAALAVEVMESARTGDGVQWQSVRGEAWAGAGRGAIDGGLAVLAMGLDRGVAPLAGEALGLTGAGAARSVGRGAGAGAVTGSVSGGITGGLDAAYTATLESTSPEAVVDAGVRGAIVGALMGAALGGAGGAWAAHHSAAELEALLSLDPEAFAARYQEILRAMTPDERADFERTLQGRRFVDRDHYEEAAADYAAGKSSLAPEHRYGVGAFEDWSGAASRVDEHAATRQPLSQEDLMDAHALAADRIKSHTGAPVPAGELRGPDPSETRLVASGGLGYKGVFSRISPEQRLGLSESPHLELLDETPLFGWITPDQRAAGYTGAIIAYPPGDTVQVRLDTFFTEYSSRWGKTDPVALAAWAEKELISIHPFVDGNGRVVRLVMDHALQSHGLPPALLHDTSLDLFSTRAAWEAEVRAGVMTSYDLAASHAAAYNAATQSGDVATAAARWGVLIGLCGTPAPLTEQTTTKEPQ